MAINPYEHRDLIGRLIGGLGDDVSFDEHIAPLTNHAHFIAPILARFASQRGLAIRVTDLGRRLLGPDNPLCVSHSYIRECITLSTQGLTLEAVVRVFSILHAILTATQSELGAEGTKMRDTLRTTFQFESIPKGIATASIYYAQPNPIAVPLSGVPNLIPLSDLIRKFSDEPHQHTFVASLPETSSLDSGKSASILRALFKGYVGNDGHSRGGYKVTKATADALYGGWSRLAAVRNDGPIEPFGRIFSNHPRSGPRDGQATRSLPISDGNIVT